MQIFKTKASFKKEFKRQVRMAIVAAIGFTIAYAWREAIYDTFNNFVARFLEVDAGHFLTHSYTAIAITLAGVIAIIITSKLFKES